MLDIGIPRAADLLGVALGFPGVGVECVVGFVFDDDYI
jgi:hypothetical protein